MLPSDRVSGAGYQRSTLAVIDSLYMSLFLRLQISPSVDIVGSDFIPTSRRIAMSTAKSGAEFVLTDALLERCRERAPVYDRENRFCAEDFDELNAAG